MSQSELSVSLSQIDSHSISKKAIQSVSKASQLISQSVFQFLSQL